MKMKYIFSLGLSFLASLGLKAQDMPKLSQIISPAPTAAALGKYGDYPVSEYTGVPNITIPLYEIKLRGITIPITLSYHASGNKVDEIAPWTGLGWSLNAGGVITRALHGWPDEFSGRGYQSQASNFTSMLIPNTSQNFNLFQGYADRTYDSEPDEFFYNFGGKSGKFVLGPNNTPILIPYDNLDIKYGFKVNDENGIQYFFNTKESTYSEPNESGDINVYTYVSSWYLSKIISSNSRDTVYFDYEQSTYQYETPRSQTRLRTNPDGVCSDPLITTSFSNITISGQRLKAIRFDNGKVIFDATQTRTDLPDEKALTGIKVYNSQGLLKQYSLSYNYRSNRLNLQSVTEKDFSGTALPSYLFIYNTTDLPEKGSYSQDHWGYYNGKSNGSLIPKTTIGSLVIGDADREVNPVTAIAQVLEKIQYPSGGYTAFSYGSNTYGVVDSVLKEKTFSVSIRCLTNQGSVTSSGTLILPTSQNVKVTYNRNFPNQLCSTNDAYITLRNSSGQYFNIIEGTDQMMFLAAGTYYAEGFAECQNCTGLKAALSINYVDGVDHVNKFRYGPGLRIEKISNYDPGDTNPKTITSFNYNTSVDPDKSSGVMVSFPVYDYTYRQKANASAPICTFYARTSNSMAVLGSTQGSPLGYKEVTRKILDGSNQDLGSVLSSYSFVNAVNHGYPFPPPINPDHLRGQLLRQKIYNKVGQLVKETVNEYQNNQIANAELLGLKIAYYYKNSSSQGIGSGSEFSYYYYTYKSAWSSLTKTTEKEFAPNASDTIKKITTYQYNAANLMPSVVTVKGSRQQDLRTNYYYPSDFPGQAPYNAMVDSNILAPVVEMQKYTGTTLLATSRTNYDTPYSGMYLPKNEVYQQNGLPLDSITSYQNYGIKGNILMQKMNKGTNTSYQWGYNKQYPVAEIKNASLNQFYYQNFEEKIVDYDGGTLDSTRAHTGRYSVKISNSGPGELYRHSTTILPVNLNAKKKFTFSGWIYSDGPSVELHLFMKKSGETGYFTYNDNVLATATNKWVYLQKEFEVPADVTNMFLRLDNNAAGNVWFDDLRIQPSDASMTTYTYQPLVGMTSSTDDKGMTTYYEYDEFQRLKNIKDQNGNIIKSYDYHYKP